MAEDGGRVVPYMALCVGHGMPLEEQVPGELDYYNLADYGDKKYAPFQKPKKHFRDALKNNLCEKTVCDNFELIS